MWSKGGGLYTCGFDRRECVSPFWRDFLVFTPRQNSDIRYLGLHSFKATNHGRLMSQYVVVIGDCYITVMTILEWVLWQQSGFLFSFGPCLDAVADGPISFLVHFNNTR